MVSRLILLLFKDLRSSAWNLKLHSNLLRLLSRPKLASWRLLRVTFKASPTTLHPLQLVEETAHNYKQKPYNSSLISSLISKNEISDPSSEYRVVSVTFACANSFSHRKETPKHANSFPHRKETPKLVAINDIVQTLLQKAFQQHRKSYRENKNSMPSFFPSFYLHAGFIACALGHSNKPTNGRKLRPDCMLSESIQLQFLFSIFGSTSWAHGRRNCHLLTHHRNSAQYMLSTTYNQSFSSLGINLSSWPVLMPVTTLRKNFYA